MLKKTLSNQTIQKFWKIARDNVLSIDIDYVKVIIGDFDKVRRRWNILKKSIWALEKLIFNAINAFT